MFRICFDPDLESMPQQEILKCTDWPQFVPISSDWPCLAQVGWNWKGLVQIYVEWALIDLDWPFEDLLGFDFDFKLLEISRNLLSLRSLCRFLLVVVFFKVWFKTFLHLVYLA